MSRFGLILAVAVLTVSTRSVNAQERPTISPFDCTSEIDFLEIGTPLAKENRTRQYICDFGCIQYAGDRGAPIVASFYFAFRKPETAELVSRCTKKIVVEEFSDYQPCNSGQKLLDCVDAANAFDPTMTFNDTYKAPEKVIVTEEDECDDSYGEYYDGVPFFYGDREYLRTKAYICATGCIFEDFAYRGPPIVRNYIKALKSKEGEKNLGKCLSELTTLTEGCLLGQALLECADNAVDYDARLTANGTYTPLFNP